MKSRFHEAAAAELTEAVEYYDATAEGLGDRLLAEVNEAVRHIEQFPESAAVVDYNVRRKVLARFHTASCTLSSKENSSLPLRTKAVVQRLARSPAPVKAGRVTRVNRRASLFNCPSLVLVHNTEAMKRLALTQTPPLEQEEDGTVRVRGPLDTLVLISKRSDCRADSG